jgi:uncharacterized RDD family membrane protein YckC
VTEQVFQDSGGRAYTVRDGVSVWLDEQPASPQVQLEYVGYGRRFAAQGLDLLVTTLINIVVVAVVTFAVVAVATAMGRDTRTMLANLKDMSAVGWLYSFLAAFAYDVVGQAVHGSTPGKMVLGITVRSADGGNCDWVQALRRVLVFYVDALFFGLVGYDSMRRSPQKQRFGDRWAGTVVVRNRSLDASQRRSAARFIGATVAACAAYAAFVGVSMFG